MGKNHQYCAELRVLHCFAGFHECSFFTFLFEAADPYAHDNQTKIVTLADFTATFFVARSKFFVLGSDSEQTEAGE